MPRLGLEFGPTHVADATTDPAFLEAVERGVDQALVSSDPQLAFLLAGADPFEEDRLGRLGVSKEGLLARDELVFRKCRSRGVPVAVVMSGGYAPRIQDTVEIHLNTVRAATRHQKDWDG